MGNISQLRIRDDEPRQEVAASIRAFIARAGISQSAAGRAIGVKQSTFSRRTNGQEPFDVDELGALATYFGVSLVELISGQIDRIPPNAKKAPTMNGEGHLLPGLDSNQEPIGLQSAPENRAEIIYAKFGDSQGLNKPSIAPILSFRRA